MQLGSILHLTVYFSLSEIMSISDLLTSSLLFYPLGSKELTDSYTWIDLQAWEQSLEEQKEALLSGPTRDVGTPGLE